MPKIQSRRKRATKAEPFETMVVDDVKQVEENIETDESNTTESNHSVYKRHQAEWRKMKHQVAQLKKQRKALTKKQRDRKKEISKEIRLMVATMRTKHEQELKELGIIPDKSAMMIDDDDEEDME